MEDPMEKLHDYKGWFWDPVNKRMYRWHELNLLMKERTLKEKKNADQLKNQRSDV
jgi:hypothetical protein